MNMEAIKDVLAPLASNTKSIKDTLVCILGSSAMGDDLSQAQKLLVVGGAVEMARRASISAWDGFVDSLHLTAHFSEEDYPYEWLMNWLSKQPAWVRSKEFDITARLVGCGRVKKSTFGDLDEEMDEKDEHGSKHPLHKHQVMFKPSRDVTHAIFYRGHWLKITHSRQSQEYGHRATLKISVFAQNNDILKLLVLEAKREYEKDVEHRVHIFTADTTHARWRWSGSRQKRQMSSVVLEPGVKERLLVDCRDFLRSEGWYAERGMPFRRGYLFYGEPRSGKTSFILSLAGELGLDIYSVSLSSKGMCDNTLRTLIENITSPCILLFEDLDTAFDRGINQGPTSPGVPTVPTKSVSDVTGGSTLSLGGLLSTLDWAAAVKSQLLFATTNHIERIDPVLIRPGRMDVWVNFTNATKWQAECIFKRFFSSPPPAPTPNEALLSTGRPAGSWPKEEIAQLARRFADVIPEGEISIASLEGCLVEYKASPQACVEGVAEWLRNGNRKNMKLELGKSESTRR